MKYKILQKLMECQGGFVSGEALSEMLGVSRTAVWKSIKELKEEGYLVDASSKKGYRLEQDCDILNSFEINYGLETKIIGKNIEFFNEIDSTNNYAKRIANEDCKDGTIVAADCQTAGKGRLGRSWDSGRKKGVWMSVVLRPSILPDEVQVITLGASVAVVKAIKKVTGIETGIKWPNDIVVEGKKLCGILTEMSCEQDRINYIVVGIGVNVNHFQEDFPLELRNKAVSIKAYAEEKGLDINVCRKDGNIRRSSIIREIAGELEKMYFDINNRKTLNIIEKWKSCSATLGREVTVNIKGVEYAGRAVDITNEGKLVVDCGDGIRREVVSGEVMVRGLMGYI